MALHFILGLVAFLAGASACLFTALVLGIRQGDHGKRLTGKPGSCTEALARHVQTGSRGCGARDSAGEGR
jgi:hypothetical protein